MRRRDEVGLTDDLIHLAERVLARVESSRLGSVDTAAVLAQADLDVDAGSSQGIAQVLRLSRSLRTPADRTDLLDTPEAVRKARELVSASQNDGFLCSDKINGLSWKYL